MSDNDVLYGTTGGGGPAFQGTIFRLRSDGADYMLLHAFGDSSGGAYPEAGLTLDRAGTLYGSFRDGVYKMSTSGAEFTLLHRFGSVNDGDVPESELLLDAGRLYGTTTLGGPSGIGTIYSLMTDGSSYGPVHEFVFDDGGGPAAALIGDRDGNIFGTTLEGGEFGGGTVFTMRSDGSEYRLLHSFETASGAPWGALVLDEGDNLYGTTSGGGPAGRGIVFAMKKDGSAYRVLHEFGRGPLDGAIPLAGLVSDGHGSLYGTTRDGGSHNLGAIFKVGSDGDGFAILHSCGDDPNEGILPTASVAVGSDGFLYGTTSEPVVVFRVKTDGSAFQVLHAFPLNDYPNRAGVVLDGAGNLYGTVSRNANLPGGLVFKMSIDGSGYDVLHSFSRTVGDAAQPRASLALEASGVLYGTAVGGGAFNGGAVFKLRTDGSGYSVLHSFERPPSYASQLPWASVYLDTRGYAYGTTLRGGPLADGLEFRLAAHPGDANGDDAITVSDVFLLINALYASGPPPLAGGDANADGLIDVMDIFYLINFLFAGGPAPHN